jgi:hypothetical protein
MGKIIRVLIVIAGLVIVGVLGMQGVAWAARLGIGGPAPAAGAPVLGLPAAARPQGTVITVPTVVEITPGALVIIGNCATAFTASVPAGVGYTATVVDQTELPLEFPGNLLSCGVRIDATPISPFLDTEIQVCFPIPPTKTASAYQHDITQWVKTTQEVSNGQSCVTIPVLDPNPTFTALFQQ